LKTLEEREPETIEELLRAAHGAGFRLTQAQRRAFATYIDTLLVWRRRLSLTTAATGALVVRRHIIDSFSLVSRLRPGVRLADIGSGAGFPGMALAIACPFAHITLVESRRKRANFLREVARRAGLQNVAVVEARAESLSAGPDELFDIVVARALGPLADFLLLAWRILKAGGQAIAMKGPRGHAEAASVVRSPFPEPEVSEYALADGMVRTLLVYRKPGADTR
jgi:16S rRNA (guanine527-N7)-methyltransferase